MNKKVECSYQRCHKRATDTGRCKSHEKAHKDREFSLMIRERDKTCRAPEVVTCSGSLQCAHVISRSYARVRLDPENAVALCQAAHMHFTVRPQEWIEWCMANGIDYWALHQRALGIPA